MVLGGFALGMFFMATDPVSAAFTNKGKWWYGILIGVMCVLIRFIFGLSGRDGAAWQFCLLAYLHRYSTASSSSKYQTSESAQWLSLIKTV